MFTLQSPRISQLSWLNRKNILISGIIVLLPLLLIGGARLLATDIPKSEVLEVARAMLEEHVHQNPPNETWQMTATRISDRGKLEMDVDVANYDQAQFILSRSGRVRHSYMKLACPELEADIYRQLPRNETLWINLHYHGAPLVKGACPLSKSLF